MFFNDGCQLGSILGFWGRGGEREMAQCGCARAMIRWSWSPTRVSGHYAVPTTILTRRLLFTRVFDELCLMNECDGDLELCTEVRQIFQIQPGLKSSVMCALQCFVWSQIITALKGGMKRQNYGRLCYAMLCYAMLQDAMFKCSHLERGYMLGLILLLYK